MLMTNDVDDTDLLFMISPSIQQYRFEGRNVFDALRTSNPRSYARQLVGGAPRRHDARVHLEPHRTGGLVGEQAPAAVLEQQQPDVLLQIGNHPGTGSARHPAHAVPHDGAQARHQGALRAAIAGDRLPHQPLIRCCFVHVSFSRLKQRRPAGAFFGVARHHNVIATSVAAPQRRSAMARRRGSRAVPRQHACTEGLCDGVN
jgi:hypothetical protein